MRKRYAAPWWVPVCASVVAPLLTILAAAVAFGAEGFAPLPDGAISTSEMGISDELILWITFDPALVADRIPEGLRLRRLEEIAAKDDAIAEHLRAHPEQRGWAWSFFEIIGTESLAVDGRKAALDEKGGMAVWYVAAARLSKDDSRPQGSQMLALETWVSDPKFASFVREKGYPWQGADVKFWKTDKRVEGRLKATDLTVSAICRRLGSPEKPDWGGTNLQTLWSPRGTAPTFEMVTFYGHRVQRCEPTWRIKGDHALARAFRARATGGERIAATEFAFDYVARSGLYRRSESPPR